MHLSFNEERINGLEVCSHTSAKSQLALDTFTLKLKSRLCLLIREDKGWEISLAIQFFSRNNCHKVATIFTCT